MPELPEVQAIAEFVGERLAGNLLASVELVSIAALKTVDPPLAALEGRVVREVRRRGKLLVVETDGPDPLVLVVGLARAGWLQWRDDMPTAPARPGRGPLALRVHAVTPDGEPCGGFDLTEAGTRKGLALWVARSADEVPRIASLGPEPLDPSFTPDALARILAEAGAAQAKGVLRDQSRIAGIGNAYSDEILHRAGMSPFARCNALGPDEVAGLHEAMRATLDEAVMRSRGQRPALLKGEKRQSMRVHGRTGEACPECGDTVREVSFADSSLQYCATCQTGGKPLADRRMSRLLR